MKTTFVVRTRSGFGTALAAMLLCLLLLLMGVWVAANGEIVGLGRAVGWGPSSLLTKWEAGAALFKSQGRLTLLFIFGGMLVLLGGVAVPMGAFIRTVEYRFDRHRGTLIRRSLWCFLPAWAAVLLVAGGGGGAFWASGASWGWAAGVFWGFIAFAGVSYGFYPRVWQWGLYVPGRRKQIPLSLIKMMEIEKVGEGGLALVLKENQRREQVLKKGAYHRLEKLGVWIARRAGLTRRDLVTWF